MKNLKEACEKLIHNEKFALSATEFLVLKDIIKAHADDSNIHPEKLKMIRATKKMHRRTITALLKVLFTEEEYKLFEETIPNTYDFHLAKFLIDYVYIKKYFLGAYELQYNYTLSFLKNELTQEDVVHYKMAAETLKNIFRIEYKWQ